MENFDFLLWLEEEHPEHNYWDTEKTDADETWLRELRIGFEAGYELGRKAREAPTSA